MTARFAAICLALALCVVTARAQGQDLIAFSRGGIYRVDQASGAFTFLASVTTPSSANAVAKDSAGRLHIAGATDGHTGVFEVDPLTGITTLVCTIPPISVRGMAFSDDGGLYVIANDRDIFGVEFPDDLLLIDLDAQTSTFVADMGLDTLQSLAFFNGRLYSYQLGTSPQSGLVEIDPATGSVNHLLFRSEGLGVQTLTFDSEGRLFGGRRTLYEFDPLSGIVLSTLPLQTGDGLPSPDIRGMEFVSSAAVKIDFENEDDFATALVNGQSISPAQEFGRLLEVEGFGANLGAAIFDSSPGGPNDPSQDPDLLVDLGNILILQNPLASTMSVPDVFDRPNDAPDSGTLVFTFPGTVEIRSLDLIDIDAGTDGPVVVTLFDAGGRLRIYDVGAGFTSDLIDEGAPGFSTLNLVDLTEQAGFAATATAIQDPDFAPRAVVRMEIQLNGSGAVDNLCFEPVSAATIQPRPPAVLRALAQPFSPSGSRSVLR